MASDSSAPVERFVALDGGFVVLLDGAFADAAQRSGPHLLCRPGCTQCCFGVFAIGPADAMRLRRGLAELNATDPARAAQVRRRAEASWARLAPDFPGDMATGRLATNPDGSPVDAFDEFAEDEPCPALDPEHGTCDLYAARPATCRSFGPPVALDGGFGMCELCFQNASVEEIAASAFEEPPPVAAAAADKAAIEAGEPETPTIISFVLATAGESAIR